MENSTIKRLTYTNRPNLCLLFDLYSLYFVDFFPRINRTQQNEQAQIVSQG